MCMALAARKGDLKVSDLKGAALDIYKSDMTDKEIEDFTVLKEDMRSLYSYIVESLEEVYHYTNYGNLERIMKGNRYIMSVNDGYGDDKFKYYMSTTRQRNALTGYPTGMINPKIIRLTLDYDKLRHVYKIEPMDWGKAKSYAIKNSYPGTDEDFDKYYDYIRMQTNVEMEERVYSNKDIIPNFNKYIKRIDVMSGWLEKYELEDLKLRCEKYGIELRIYNTEKQFNLAK